MWELEHTQPHIWNYFLEGNLSVQKSPLPGVAIGCDHAGEQVNSEDKSRGGLKGNTRNTNARNRQYLTGYSPNCRGNVGKGKEEYTEEE